MGQAQYPQARQLLITAGGGGSNSSRCRLWKWCLQQLATETGLEVAVSHFPPATSKWNKIEHRLFGLELGRRAKRVHGRLYVEGVKGLLACFRRERLISFGGCYDSHFYGEADRARKVSRPMNHYEELAKAEPGCLCRVGRVVTRS